VGSVLWEEQPVPFKLEPLGTKIPLAETLHKQASGQEPLLPPFAASLPWLAHLLHHTGGITAKVVSGDSHTFLRANPSAGGLFPIEIYVIILKSDTLEPGIYHYHPLHLALYFLKPLPSSNELKEIFLNHSALESCPALIVNTGLFSRATWRYKERTYRRMLLDCGHALGNTLEMAQYYHVPAVHFTGFIDSQLSELLDLDSSDEVPLTVLGLASEDKKDNLVNLIQPGEAPAKAVQRTIRGQKIQQQQNTCEQIPAGCLLRPAVKTSLSKYSEIPKDTLPFPQLIAMRRSCREMSGEHLTQEEFYTLLNHVHKSHAFWSFNLSPEFLETQIIVLRVEGLQAGLYKWDELLGQPELKLEGDFQAQTYQFSLGQEIAASCAFLIVHTVRLPELIEQFGDRGYRYATLSAGIAGQRLNLVCGHLGLGSTGIGGYFDDDINTCLNLSLQEAILYVTAVGKPSLP